MKDLRTVFAAGVRLYRGALVAVLLTLPAVYSEGQIYTLTSSPSTVTFDTASGLTGWQLGGGPNQLNLQSLYYSVANGAVSALTAPSVVINSAASITATYTVAGVLSVADTFTVNGSTLGEQIRFKNLSATANTFSVFQYSDFILGSAPGSQTLDMTVYNSTQAGADQSGGGTSLQWLGQLVGGTVEVQADSSGGPFGPFNGSATSLTGNPLNATGNVVFGYEFDASLASGNSKTISETASLAVPEPSSLALVVLAALSAKLGFGRKKA